MFKNLVTSSTVRRPRVEMAVRGRKAGSGIRLRKDLGPFDVGGVGASPRRR